MSNTVAECSLRTQSSGGGDEGGPDEMQGISFELKCVSYCCSLGQLSNISTNWRKNLKTQMVCSMYVGKNNSELLHYSIAKRMTETWIQTSSFDHFTKTNNYRWE